MSTDSSNNPTKAATAQLARRPVVPWLVAIVVFAAEFAILGAMSAGLYPEIRKQGGLFLLIAGQTPNLVRAGGGLVLMSAAYLAAQSVISPQVPESALNPPRIAFAIHFASDAALLILFSCLALNVPVSAGERYALISLSALVWAILIASAAFIIFRGRNPLLGREKLVIIGVFVVVLVIFQYNESLSEVLISGALLPLALKVASAILGLVGLSTTVRPDQITGNPLFSAGSFEVEIAPSCAGYEGIVIAFLVLAAYVVWQWRNVRIWRALSLFPIVAIILLTLNCLRLAALVYIGSKWSPAIATIGFHVYFGWVYIIIVTVIAVYLLETHRYFQLAHSTSSNSFNSGDLLNDGAFLLVPFLIFTLLSLILGAFAGTFAWLYPANVLVTSSVIFVFRDRLLSRIELSNSIGPVVGVGVALMWIMMIPEDHAKSSEFAQELFSASAPISVVWLIFRVFGSIVVAPIIEELAFRGVIQPQLDEGLTSRIGPLGSVVAIAATSAVFGILHDQFLPAALAGMAYGWLKHKYGSIWPSILAHGATNAVIATYAVIFSAWSYL